MLNILSFLKTEYSIVRFDDKYALRVRTWWNKLLQTEQYEDLFGSRYRRSRNSDHFDEYCISVDIEKVKQRLLRIRPDLKPKVQPDEIILTIND